MLKRIGATLHVMERSARQVYVVDVLWRAFHEFQRQDGTTSAAAISYYVLFSLFPLLTFLVAVFGIIARDAEIQESVVNAIVDQFPDEVNLQRQVESVVLGVTETDSSLIGLIGVLGMAWTASGMFRALRRALNRAFDVPRADSFVRGAVTDLLSVVGAMVLATLSVATTTVLATIRLWAGDYVPANVLDSLWRPITMLIPLFLSFLTFLVVYGLIPNRRPKMPELWVGALLAAVAFEFAKAGFGWYVRHFGNYQEVYGAIGGVVAALVFVYLAATIVIYVAQLTSELAKDREARRERPKPAAPGLPS
ncbi:MAG: YihY/virulence factor BrkB family protein [Dehalococcoidia bacterium]